MAGASMLVHVTHIDDSPRGRQGPCVYFWGMTHDRSLYLLMEKYLESVRHYLETMPPPLNLNVLDQVCCVLINHQWHRARVPELKLSHAGTIEVFCIDSGDTHSVPLAFVRTLDIPGHEAEHIREWPPLASKFILADMVAPRGPGSRSQWSEPAMMFLKIHVENRTWKAAPMGMYGEHQGVRLFDSNNQLLATLMIQQGLGVAAQTYHEALNMCDVLERQPAYMKAAANIGQIGGNSSVANNTLPPAFAIPSTYRDKHPAFTVTASYSSNHSPIPPRAFVTNDIPHTGRHDVIVTHIPDGPLKFYVQLKSEIKDLMSLRIKLDTVVPRPIHGKPKLGTPCIAVSPTDKLFHRGLITGVSECGNQCSCTVYFADIGTQELVSLSLICHIPDELLMPRLFAYRVSLFGVEEVLKLTGLKEIFTALVSSAAYLQVEVVEDDDGKQKVNLYDPNGHSLREVLVSIHSNLLSTKSQTVTSSPSTPPKSNVATCITDISPVQLDLEESLCVITPEEPGCFFGQFEKIPVDSLNEMVSELTAAYSTNSNAPLLYADVRSHLGHYGVVLWEEDNNFYRIQITKEMVNDAEIHFIDYGNFLQVPRCKILAPLDGLARFRCPPFGIHCRLEGDVTLSASEWKEAILDKSVMVTVGKCENGIYSVTLTNDPCNCEIIKMVTKKVAPTCNVLNNTPAVSVRSDSSSSVAAQVVPPAEPQKQSDDRRRRNKDIGNFGRSHYLHPNAKESNWRSAGTEEAPPSVQTKSSSKESNWRFSANPIQEVIRAPRGPPPATGNGETKGPIGFQRLGSTEKLQPPVTKPITELSPSVVIPTIPKPVAEVPVQKKLSYPAQVLPGVGKQIEVICVVNPSSFYVRLIEASSPLADMVHRLFTVYSDETQPFILNATAGSACAVQYEEDNQWYRGKIVELKESSLTPQVTVLFVDYGNIQLCSMKQVKYIDESLVQLPPLAYHCKLKGVEGSRAWTVEEENKFKDYSMKKTLTATFTACDSEGKYPIRLVDENESVKIVINDLFGATTTSVPPPSVGYTYLPVPDTPIDVNVAWYHNPGRIFTSPVDLSVYQSELDELEQFYSSLSPDGLVEDQPKVGLPCVARFTEDGRYYRSRILTIQDSVAKVLFVDYGNEQDTPLSQLKRIVPRFMKFPQLTWHSKLKGVKKMASGPLNPNPQKHIAACFLTEQTLSASFHPVGPDNSGVFEVNLVLPGIGDVAQYLIQQKILDSIPVEIETTFAVQNVNFAPGQIISTHAVATHMNSATEFWVHLEPESVSAIMARIDALTLDPKFISAKDYTASVGKPCLAFFADDGRWYRALVESVDEDTATVYYVDYGNSCSVKTSDLRALPVDVARQSAFAYKCSVVGAEAFTEEVALAFENFIFELEAFSVHCVNVTGGTLNVRLYTTDGVDLIEQLCNTHLNRPPIEELPVEDGVSVPLPTTETREEVIAEESVPFISSVIEEDLHNTPGIPEPSTLESVAESQLPIERVKVYVSYSVSPNEFWLQLRQNDDVLVEMLDEIAQIYEADKESFRIKGQPLVHQIYGVHHPSYGGWYRAEVKGISDDTAEVCFVDYGDTLTVPLENVLDLPEKFSSIPAMAIRGNLSMESPLAIAETFNAVCFQPDQMQWASLGTDENGVRFVKSLFIGDANVLDLITVEEPVAAPYDVSLSTIPEALIEQSVQTPTGSSPDRSVEVLVCSEDVSLSSAPVPEAEIKVEDDSSLDLEALPTLEFNFAPGQRMSTYASVSHIESPAEIWIQLDPTAVDNLMSEIAAVDVSTLTAAKPRVGSHCLAPFPDDGQWYRAVITQRDAGSDEVRVTYVDYGNSSMVKNEDLRVLPTHFAEQPALAFKCALDGIERNVISSPSTDQCTSVLQEEILAVAFSSRTSDCIFVRLFDTTGSDLNEKLGLPETFKIEVVGANLLEFTALDDVEMASPLPKATEPAVSNLFGEQSVVPLEMVTPHEMAEETTEATPTVAAHTDICNAEVVDVMQQIAVKNNEPADKFVQITDEQSLKDAGGIDWMRPVAMKANDVDDSHPQVVAGQLENEGDTIIHRFEQTAAEEDHFAISSTQIAVDCPDNAEGRMTDRMQQPTVVAAAAASPVRGVVGDLEIEEKEVVDSVQQTAVKDGDLVGSLVQIAPAYLENEDEVNMQQVAITENDLPESFSDSIDSFMRQAVLEQNVELKENEVREQLAILEQEAADAEGGADIGVQETTHFASPNDETTTEDSSVPEHDPASVVACGLHTDTSSIVLHPPVGLAVVDSVALEGSQVVAPLAKTQEGITESPALPDPCAHVDQTIGGNLFDERVVMRIKTEVVSDHEDDPVPKGNVYVSYVMSPGDFWMQKTDDEQTIGDVDNSLTDLNLDTSSKYELNEPPVVGNLYAAKHHDFGYWYRARLLKMEDNVAEVNFVDYGDTKVVTTADIRYLPRVLQGVPPMAFPCKLAALHLDCWPEKATKVMKDLCHPEEDCRATFRTKADGIVEVDSLVRGKVDVVGAILSSLVCEHHVDGPSLQPVQQAISPQQNDPYIGTSQVDAQLLFIRVQPDKEVVKTSRDLVEGESSLPVE
uniref:Tudor domain-containing protein n=1 Tax=Daphnia magna TaxID=35525 RepID=A0A0P6EK20_9CRUS